LKSFKKNILKFKKFISKKLIIWGIAQNLLNLFSILIFFVLPLLFFNLKLKKKNKDFNFFKKLIFLKINFKKKKHNFIEITLNFKKNLFIGFFKKTPFI
jgi:hypothetical protein